MDLLGGEKRVRKSPLQPVHSRSGDARCAGNSFSAPAVGYVTVGSPAWIQAVVPPVTFMSLTKPSRPRRLVPMLER